MGNTSMLLLLFCAALILLVQSSHATTMVVDGLTVWKTPTVHIGDSIIFKHKYEYKLYIFQNEKAFSNCDFSQATLLNKPNSTSFTWFPSRVGLFYFSFNNASLTTCQKLPIKVIPPPPQYVATPPELPPTSTPSPISGGTVPSSPVYPWPFHPRQASSPSPGPSSSSSTTSSSLMPEKGGGVPFINSNPAVPLPTGEVDSATIQPLPTSHCRRIQVVGLTAIQMSVWSVVLLLFLL